MAAPDATSLLPVSGGTLLIDANSAPGSVLADQLVRLTNGTPIVVSGAERTVVDGIVTVVGQASLLNRRDLEVTATATPGPDSPVVTVRFTLIQGTPDQAGG
jgi:hypothetical protein